MLLKIGVIGGTGLDNPDLIEGRKEIFIATPFGDPSDVIIQGRIRGVHCVLLARHGRFHTISPSNINYRANIWALKEIGCTHILVTTACGSLKEEIRPGDLVIIDQFIDRTTKRKNTFHDGSANSLPGVCHIPMAEPFCSRVREILIDTATALGYRFHSSGTIVTIEGPRYSSKAESNLFRSWGADLVSMTTVPEVVLANELGLCYASIGIVTDYDCWHTDSQEAVSVKQVTHALEENVHKATELLVNAIGKMAEVDWDQEIKKKSEMAKGAVMLPP